MTLIEVTIAVAIVALAVAVSVPAVSNISAAELRASSGKLCGLIRQTYNQAALEGQTHRIAFDFEKKKIVVSATEQVLAFEPDSNVLAEASKLHEDRAAFHDLADKLRLEAEEMRELSGDDTPNLNVAAAFFGVNDLAKKGGLAGDEAFRPTEMEIDLADSVRLMDVWVRGMDEPATEGVQYLYFFPHGYTQDALIHLVDEEERVFTVKVRALTGRTQIVPDYVEPKT